MGASVRVSAIAVRAAGIILAVVSLALAADAIPPAPQIRADQIAPQVICRTDFISIDQGHDLGVSIANLSMSCGTANAAKPADVPAAPPFEITLTSTAAIIQAILNQPSAPANAVSQIHLQSIAGNEATFNVPEEAWNYPIPDGIHHLHVEVTLKPNAGQDASKCTVTLKSSHLTFDPETVDIPAASGTQIGQSANSDTQTETYASGATKSQETTVTSADGTVKYSTTRTEYDESGRATSETETTYNGGRSDQTHEKTWVYDAKGRLLYFSSKDTVTGSLGDVRGSANGGVEQVYRVRKKYADDNDTTGTTTSEEVYNSVSGKWHDFDGENGDAEPSMTPSHPLKTESKPESSKTEEKPKSETSQPQTPAPVQSRTETGPNSKTDTQTETYPSGAT